MNMMMLIHKSDNPKDHLEETMYSKVDVDVSLDHRKQSKIKHNSLWGQSHHLSMGSCNCDFGPHHVKTSVQCNCIHATSNIYHDGHEKLLPQHPIGMPKVNVIKS